MANNESVNTETKVLSTVELRGSQKNSGFYFTVTVIEGRDFGCIFQLDKAETTIGRKDEDGTKPDVELNDERTSRRHLLLVKKPFKDNTSQIVAIDLGSKNGTYLNGQRITGGEVQLHTGDKLQVGNTVLKFEIKDNIDASFQERLYQQVTRDPQTGLWNHNYAKQEIEKLVSMGTRSNISFSVVLIEIDFFQTLNETYGRAVGDNVLRAVAQRIGAEISDYEIAARFGGTQILIILPETDMAGALSMAERLRQAIEKQDFSAQECNQRITVSGGIAQFPICAKKGDELLKQVDEALFRAKQLGRNRIVKAEATQQETGNAKNKIAVAVIALILIAALVGIGRMVYPTVVAMQQAPKELLFSGTVETHEVEVGSKIGGRITEVLVKEGDLLKAGQPLVRFDIADLLAQQSLQEARINQFQANLERLQNGFRKEEIEEAEATVRKESAVLEELKNGPRKQEIAQAKAELAAAVADLDNFERTFRRIEEVYKNGYQSKQARDDAENRVKLGKARVDALQERLSQLEEGTRNEEIVAAQERQLEAIARAKLLRTGSRIEDVAAARAELSAAKAELERIKVQIAEGEIKAPSDSRVEVMDTRPGDVLAAGKPIAKLLEQDQIWVRTYVPHSQIGRVQVGQKASIVVDSFPGKTFSGYVEQVAEEAEFYPRNVQSRSDREHQVFAIKVHIDAKDGKLKSGMSADVTLEPKN
jgi:HlyD family secretion protein